MKYSLIASGTYGTKFQSRAYPQIKIKIINPVHSQLFDEKDALIDSGASGTMIPTETIEKLALQATNIIDIQDFENSAPKKRGVYSVKIELGTETFSLQVAETKGYAIVGRDILNKLITTLKGKQQKWEMN